MSNKLKPSVLVLLNRLPDETSFLNAKFAGVSEHLDFDIIAWDTTANRRRCRQILKSRGFKGRIYLAPVNFTFVSAAKFIIGNAPIFILKAKTILRFLREGKMTLGSDILKRLFFDFYFIRSAHDIWHLEFGATSAWHYYLKAVFPDKKLVVSFRGYDLNYVGLDDPAYYANTWRYFDAFHFLGYDLRQRAVRRGYKGAAVESIIPPAVDCSFFTPALGYAPNAGKLVIVSTGRLVWKKGYEYAIRAMALLKEKNVPFEYRIIGDGEYRQALQYIIHELGLKNEVRLLGKMSASGVKEQLQEAAVFLHPAVSEGFCNAVLEAQAMGVPVVCTDADGLSENVIDNETGFIVPKWDAIAIVTKLEWCYNNREAAQAMGLKGIDRVNKNFRIEDQIQAFVEFYRKAYES